MSEMCQTATLQLTRYTGYLINSSAIASSAVSILRPQALELTSVGACGDGSGLW